MVNLFLLTSVDVKNYMYCQSAMVDLYIYIMKCSLSLISSHMVSVCEYGAGLKFHICVCAFMRNHVCVYI